MQKTILFITCLIAAGITNAQTAGTSMAVDFKQLAMLGSRETGVGIQTYKSANIDGSQFFNNNWSSGSVTTVNNETMKNYLFIFDKVRQDLYLRPKDSNYVIIADKSRIASFVINTDRPHTFVLASKYDPSQKNNFFEVLAENSDYTLLKSVETKFEKASNTDLEKIKEGNMNDAFVDNVNYYVYHNNALTPLKLTRRSIYKALKDKSNELNDFFTTHDNDELNETLLIQLFSELNG